MDEKDQMEAVFKSSRIDPVSGNEVPTGSLPEEVRDDIDAKLSEGEYVVPADVVRYFGVRFFEDLRTKAKQGWTDMEANGRVGGEPINGMEVVEPEDDLPFSLEELQTEEVEGYAEGGLVTKTYVNEAGQKIPVQFQDGTPITAIPQGFREEGSERPDVTDWSMASPQDFEDYLDQRNSFMGTVVKKGVGLLGGPIMGLALSAADRYQYNTMMKGLESQLGREDLDPDVRFRLANIQEQERQRSKQSGIERSGVFGGEKRLKDSLQDTSGDGKTTFGDTWLGDLLGLDGKFGVQGASLKASRAGARRGAVANDKQGKSKAASRRAAKAATGSTRIKDSDGTTRKVTTYDRDEVQRLAKEGKLIRGGR